jgi:hypothetical protein
VQKRREIFLKLGADAPLNPAGKAFARVCTLDAEVRETLMELHWANSAKAGDAKLPGFRVREILAPMPAGPPLDSPWEAGV